MPRVRVATFLFALTVTLLVVAAPAFAGDNGEGLAGETNDKVVTFFSLGVILFFTLFVGILSVLQARKEKRKEERQAAQMRQRIGW